MSETEFDLNKALKSPIENYEREINEVTERQNKIDEIKEDLRLTLDIIKEMSKEYSKLDSIAWPVTMMMLFNEIRQTRINHFPIPLSTFPVDADFTEDKKDPTP